MYNDTTITVVFFQAMNLTFLLDVLALVLSCPLLATAQSVYCGRGEYLVEGKDTCMPCEEGYFQDRDKHK